MLPSPKLPHMDVYSPVGRADERVSSLQGFGVFGRNSKISYKNRKKGYYYKITAIVNGHLKTTTESSKRSLRSQQEETVFMVS